MITPYVATWVRKITPYETIVVGMITTHVATSVRMIFLHEFTEGKNNYFLCGYLGRAAAASIMLSNSSTDTFPSKSTSAATKALSKSQWIISKEDN